MNSKGFTAFRFKRDMFLFFVIFTVSAVCGAIYSRICEADLPIEGVYAHFSMKLGKDFIENVKFFSKAFYDDAFDLLCLCVSGFWTFGKFMDIGLISVRGATFGYYVFALANTYAEQRNIFSLYEYFCYLFFEVLINSILVYFANKAWHFCTEVKKYFPNRLRIIKTSYFFKYITEMIFACGIIAFFKVAYTIIIVFL